MNHNGRDTAREARESAAVRAQELHERHVDLLSEKPPTTDGLRRAREALTEARRRATAAHRRSALAPYRLDDALLDRAADGAVALHCLPAHPGEEVSDAVLYGDRQRIWDQAENRRHAQKALLELLVNG